jgi:RTX calcium-binding nonapeptide repeat (4 copies)
MSGNAHGGDDSFTATNSSQGSVSSLWGDAYGLDGNAQGGNDFFAATNSGSNSYSNLYGDAIGMGTTTQGGDDILNATNSGNYSYAYLYGDALDMSGTSQGGDDTLTATDSGVSSYSQLFGDAANMYDNARGGNDFLNGGVGNDTLYGDAESYFNPSSPGSITGGTDTLNGGAGNDQLWGGPNDDKLVFGVGSGNDSINDFNQGNLAVGSTATEHDLIDVHAYGFADWNALHAAISDDVVSGNAVIHLSATDSITLIGVHTADLVQTDFII